MTAETIIALVSLAASTLGGFFAVVRYLLGRIDHVATDAEHDLKASIMVCERERETQWQRGLDHFAKQADMSALTERLDALDRRSIEILAEVKELRR